MRFASAREAGLDEYKVGKIVDGYEDTLSPKEILALKLTDQVIGLAQPLGDAMKAELKKYYSDAEIVELTIGVALFLSMSKVLITLGLEPEEMATTVMPTPGSQ